MTTSRHVKVARFPMIGGWVGGGGGGGGDKDVDQWRRM